MSYQEVTLHMTSGAKVEFVAKEIETKRNALGEWTELNVTRHHDRTLPTLHKVRLENIEAITFKDVIDTEETR